MQDDMDADWGEGDEMHRFIQEEPTRVVHLPTLTRYRTFTHAIEHDPIRIGRSEQDFFPHKKRRYGDRGCDDASQPYAQPLLRSLKDPFDIASRRMDTLVWLTTQTRTPQEVSLRFAVDRKIGVSPSQACINRTIQSLGSSGDVGYVLDIVEDAALDSTKLALSTVLVVLRALNTQPVRAARLALSLQATLPANVVLPVAVWRELGSALARHAQRLPKPLDEHFMELLDATIDVVRGESNTLSEALLADYGSCLLASRRPLSAAVRLVGNELLTGRNQAHTNNERTAVTGAEDEAALPLGAFLTDLLVALCTRFQTSSGQPVAASSGSAAATGDAVSNERTAARRASSSVGDAGDGSVAPAATSAEGALSEWTSCTGLLNAAELVAFCGDVVKYAFARKILLAPKAFDAVLAVCDEARDYYRACILFTAMCVLSVPTLRSTLRIVEVLTAVPVLQSTVAASLGRTPQAMLIWCLRRFGSIVSLHTPPSAKEEAALLALCAAVSTFVVDTPAATAQPDFDAKMNDDSANLLAATVAPAAVLSTTCVSQIQEVAVLLLAECASPRYAANMISAAISEARRLSASVAHSNPASPGTRPTPEQLQALKGLNATAIESLFQEPGAATTEAGSRAPQHPLFEDAAKLTGGSTIEGAIKLVLASQQVYCNVLDASAMNLLAAHPQAEVAFTKMMAGYMNKFGAVTVFPIELLSVSFGASEEARALVRAWRHAHSDWFTVLPLSLSFQLVGTNDVTITSDFFLRVRATGHQKVALMTGKREGAESAKALGVQPAILLPDLLRKLGVETAN